MACLFCFLSALVAGNAFMISLTETLFLRAFRLNMKVSLTAFFCWESRLLNFRSKLELSLLELLLATLISGFPNF